jgi:hypothetical protein
MPWARRLGANYIHGEIFKVTSALKKRWKIRFLLGDNILGNNFVSVACSPPASAHTYATTCITGIDKGPNRFKPLFNKFGLYGKPHHD